MKNKRDNAQEQERERERERARESKSRNRVKKDLFLLIHLAYNVTIFKGSEIGNKQREK